jgi:formamidopyrimidine-DNA glycosylase
MGRTTVFTLGCEFCPVRSTAVLVVPGYEHLMPELPEVEVTRLSFAAEIFGAKISAVRLGKPLRWPLGCSPEQLVGQTVGLVSRRGKYLWLALSNGGILLHLGMSGSLSFGLPDTLAGPHHHFDLFTTQGLLRLKDPRRFGAVVWSASLAHAPAATLLSRLGQEPFDPGFTGAAFHRALHGRRACIKQVILAGAIVVGAGNIYVCEALFAAGVNPQMPAGQLSLEQASRLAEAIRDVLSRAVALGGSTLRDFHNAQGASGHFQLQYRVYGRQGQPCHSCKTSIERLVQGQRSTFFCLMCQPHHLGSVINAIAGARAI